MTRRPEDCAIRNYWHKPAYCKQKEDNCDGNYPLFVCSMPVRQCGKLSNSFVNNVHFPPQFCGTLMTGAFCCCSFAGRKWQGTLCRRSFAGRKWQGHFAAAVLREGNDRGILSPQFCGKKMTGYIVFPQFCNGKSPGDNVFRKVFFINYCYITCFPSWFLA